MFVNQDGTISDVPTALEVEPQSLAHVAISNAEKIWNKRVEREEFLKKRAQIRKEMELKKKILADLKKQKQNMTAEMDMGGKGKMWSIETRDDTGMIQFGNLTNNGTNVKSGLFKSNGSSSNRRMGSKIKASSSSSKYEAAMPFVVMMTLCTIFRLCFSLAIGRFSLFFGVDIEEDDVPQRDDSNGPFWTRRQLRRRARAQQRQRQFQGFVDRLNAQRVENGERPITAESLRLVVSDRDFNGNDYERLWQFHNENGPAIGSLLSSIGATEAEIGRCPSRTLGEGDDLLGDVGRTEVDGRNNNTCSVCLEAYRVGDTVRTIPCFHTFHTGCIDPWLSERAECPICKHSAIG